MTSVTKPNSRFILAAKNTNSSMSETPVTISGLTIGMFVMFITIALGTLRMELIPIAARVPSSVAAMLAITAIMMVFISEEMMTSLRNSFAYQSSVNPLNTERLLVSLNENTISTKIGTYRNIRTSPMYTLERVFNLYTPFFNSEFLIRNSEFRCPLRGRIQI